MVGDFFSSWFRGFFVAYKGAHGVFKARADLLLSSWCFRVFFVCYKGHTRQLPYSQGTDCPFCGFGSL